MSSVPVLKRLYWYLHAWREGRDDFSGNGILITPIKLVAHRLDQHVACILIILSPLGVVGRHGNEGG